MEIGLFLHYGAQVFAVGIATCGGSLGEGMAAARGLEAMNRQHLGIEAIFKAMVIGLALIETGSILTLVLALLLLFTTTGAVTTPMGIAECGIALAIGVSSFVVGIASSCAVQGGSESIARQPFFAQKILILQVIIQSIIESPVLFSFVIGILIFNQISPTIELPDAIRLLAAGVTIGFGSIGPAIGQMQFSKAACRAIGISKTAYSKLFSFSLLSETFIETPIIFCLLISFLLLFFVESNDSLLSMICKITGAGTVAIGIMGPSIAIGRVTAQGCTQIAQNQDHYSLIVRSTFMAAGFIDSSAIYSLIIALLLIVYV